MRFLHIARSLQNITHPITMSTSIVFNGVTLTPSTKITDNFTWGEATKGLTRIPENPTTFSYIKMAANELQVFRNRYGKPFVIQSWYRDPKTNAAVGGASNSLHLSGLAIDFHIVGYNMKQFYQENSNFPGGLGYYPNSGHWCHIDFRNLIGKPKARWIN